MPPGSIWKQYLWVYLLHGFFWSCSPSFSAVWRCVLWSSSCWLLKWMWVKGASFNLSFPSWTFYSEYAHFNHAQLTASSLIYGTISSGSYYYYYFYTRHAPTPRCLPEHDDSKSSKIGIFRSHYACSIDCHANERRGWRLCSSYRAVSWILYASSLLPHVERTFHHALSAFVMICDRLGGLQTVAFANLDQPPALSQTAHCPITKFIKVLTIHQKKKDQDTQ